MDEKILQIIIILTVYMIIAQAVMTVVSIRKEQHYAQKQHRLCII